MMRLRYVNADHTHPLRGQTGEVLIRSKPGSLRLGRGPRNVLVQLESGALVCAPYGNWRPA